MDANQKGGVPPAEEFGGNDISSILIEPMEQDQL